MADPLQQARAGILLRDQGALDAAAAIFQRLTETEPGLVYGWQELGVLHALRGDHDTALRLFTHAVVVAPADLQTRRHLALHLARRGQPEAALAALRAHPAGAERDIALLMEFVGYLAAFPEHAALRLAESFETGGRHLPPTAVEQRILDAIANRAPLSLIRLGDGEGAWLRVDDADEARFPLLHAANRRAMLKIWFGSDADHGRPSFHATQPALEAAIARADIVGLPYGLRLAHEYRIGSLRGVTACVNLLRRLDRARQASPSAYCSQDIHLDLHRRDFYARLLRPPITVGVVSCHPDLGDRLSHAFSARVARMLIVPEEMGFAGVDAGLSAITGVSGMTEAHFPFAFRRITDRLAREAARAQVWLIAAGYLGKLYCDTVRQAGSVALDVGSIVDGWCGAVTRPYLRGIAGFAL